METYSVLRELADSWVLLGLVAFFLGTWVWAFRPGSRDLHSDAADVPFRHDDAPEPDLTPGCTGQCDTCRCISDTQEAKP